MEADRSGLCRNAPPESRNRRLTKQNQQRRPHVHYDLFPFAAYVACCLSDRSLELSWLTRSWGELNHGDDTAHRPIKHDVRSCLDPDLPRLGRCRRPLSASRGPLPIARWRVRIHDQSYPREAPGGNDRRTKRETLTPSKIDLVCRVTPLDCHGPRSILAIVSRRSTHANWIGVPYSAHPAFYLYVTQWRRLYFCPSWLPPCFLLDP